MTKEKIPTAITGQAIEEWNARGLLAESLQCWHRLTENESTELVNFVVALQAQPEQELYNELLFAVARVHPNETRHQTALRYIQQAESVVAQNNAKPLMASKEKNNG